ALVHLKSLVAWSDGERLILHETPETPRDFELFHKSLLPKAGDFALLRPSMLPTPMIETPMPLPIGRVPVTSVPMMLPTTWLFSPAEMSTPSLVLPEISLPAPAAVPPMSCSTRFG